MGYRYNRLNKLKYYTGQKVPTKYFTNSSLVSRTFVGASSINQYLRKLKYIAEDVNREMLLNGNNFSNAEFKKALEIKIGRIQKQLYWYDYADLDYQEKLKIKGDPQKVRGDKSRYELLKSLIKNTTLDKLNDIAIQKAIDSMFNKGLSPSYVKKVISQLYKLLRKAKRQKHNVCLDFESIQPIKNIKHKEQIFCTLEELEKMYFHKYKHNYLRNAANIFLIGAFTSMRVSEYMEVAKNPDQFIYTIQKDKKTIKLLKILSTDKTKKKVTIPMHYIIDDMLKNYKIHAISEVNLNKYLKIIGETIGMTQLFKRIEYKGRNEIEVTYKRFQLLSSHTARRSFVTILYLMNVDLKIIRMFTTHSTEAQLLKYMKLDSEMNAIRMAEHDFFTKRPALKIVR